jgi:DNA-binding NarL/FixJ family response regulator
LSLAPTQFMQCPDVVIMDARMPVLNGIEATRLITSDYPDTRVIGFTMDSESNLGAAMKNAGAADCICKSDSIEVLIATIRDCCTT